MRNPSRLLFILPGTLLLIAAMVLPPPAREGNEQASPIFGVTIPAGDAL